MVEAIIHKIGTHVQVLKLGHCFKLGDKAIKKFANFSLKSCEELSISHCKKISQVGFKALFQSCGPSLTKLDVSWTNISDNALKLIYTNCKQLSSVHLDWCRFLSENAILALVRSCTGIYTSSLLTISNQTPFSSQM